MSATGVGEEASGTLGSGFWMGSPMIRLGPMRRLHHRRKTQEWGRSRSRQVSSAGEALLTKSDLFWSFWENSENPWGFGSPRISLTELKFRICVYFSKGYCRKEAQQAYCCICGRDTVEDAFTTLYGVLLKRTREEISLPCYYRKGEPSSE